MTTQPLTQREREKHLYEYSVALEHGDFDIVGQILELAEQDPILEHMIIELNVADESEHVSIADKQASTLVQNLLREHLSSGVAADEVDLPPLAVGDVVARIQSNAALRGTLAQEVATAVEQLRQDKTPLPADLGQQRVQQLLRELGLSFSRSFEKLFRNTAIFLAMGREQGVARLAATRRQQQQAAKHVARNEDRHND